MDREFSESYVNFDKSKYSEIERKYEPLHPEQLAYLLPTSEAIEQFYLSHPEEPFSLRFRETASADGTAIYTATLKNRGTQTTQGLERLEVEIEIDAGLYDYYKAADHPLLIRKLRAVPIQGVVVDFFEDGFIQCESENPEAWGDFTLHTDLTYRDITCDIKASNEWRAHQLHQSSTGEQLHPSTQLDSETVLNGILEHLQTDRPLIVSIVGRSGSGKSTILREVVRSLEQVGIGSLTLSTDDYHRGKLWLDNYKGSPWSEWDAPIVYDVDTLVADINRLVSGTDITRRKFDFSTSESDFGETISAQPVILIEGIYAGSESIHAISHLSFDMKTPLATCVGRRLLRDLKERPVFANPEKSLRYILEQAEPAYRAIASEQ